MAFKNKLLSYFSIWRILPVIIFWVIFAYVILNINYPDSLAEASSFQLAVFFFPLFLALAFTLNLFVRFILFSLCISLGLIILLILQALNSLNLASAILTVISISLLLSYFKQLRKKRGGMKSNISAMVNLGRIK